MCFGTTPTAKAPASMKAPAPTPEKTAPDVEQIEALDELIEQAGDLYKNLDRRTTWQEFERGYNPDGTALGRAWDKIREAQQLMKQARSGVRIVSKAITTSEWA